MEIDASSLPDIREELGSKSTELLQKSSAIEKMEKKMAEMKLKHLEDIKRREGENQQLLSESAALTNENTEKMEKLMKTQSELQKTSLKLTSAQTKLSREVDRAQKANQQIEKLQKSLEETEESNRKLEESKLSLDIKVQTLLTDIGKIKGNLTSLDLQKQSLERKLNAALQMGTLDDQSVVSSASQMTTERAKSVLRREKDKIQKLQNANATLQGQVKELERNLKTMTETANEKEHIASELESQINLMGAELESTQEQLKKKVDEVLELKAKLDDHQRKPPPVDILEFQNSDAISNSDSLSLGSSESLNPSNALALSNGNVSSNAIANVEEPTNLDALNPESTLEVYHGNATSDVNGIQPTILPLSLPALPAASVLPLCLNLSENQNSNNALALQNGNTTSNAHVHQPQILPSIHPGNPYASMSQTNVCITTTVKETTIIFGQQTAATVVQESAMPNFAPVQIPTGSMDGGFSIGFGPTPGRVKNRKVRFSLEGSDRNSELEIVPETPIPALGLGNTNNKRPVVRFSRRKWNFHPGSPDEYVKKVRFEGQSTAAKREWVNSEFALTVMGAPPSKKTRRIEDGLVPGNNAAPSAENAIFAENDVSPSSDAVVSVTVPNTVEIANAGVIDASPNSDAVVAVAGPNLDAVNAADQTNISDLD